MAPRPRRIRCRRGRNGRRTDPRLPGPAAISAATKIHPSKENNRMNIALLGTGTVAQTIAPTLEAKGHAVRVGSRTPAAVPAGLAKHAGTARDAIATAE